MWISKKISKMGLIGAIGFGLISLVLLPSWPLSWLEISKQTRHLIPVLYGPGPLLILAVLRWRVPEGRLLLLMAFMPQRAYFYDQLSILLVAKTLRQQLVIVLMSWTALFATIIIGPTWHWPATYFCAAARVGRSGNPELVRAGSASAYAIGNTHYGTPPP